MATKRGASGLSLIVGVDKPRGMSSHDVVNRCRTIFGERRVGHCGTLDPAASGVLLVCIGPATRLDAYLTNHDKTYRMRVSFGAETTTDDVEGEVTATGLPDARLRDADFARSFCEQMVGPSMQVPPAYSALKRDGRKACDEARAGRRLELEPRPIMVNSCVWEDFSQDEDGRLCWDVSIDVSKGTYIRAIARDMGRTLGCPAHLAALDRTRLGCVSKADCVSLESLAELRERAALDPLALLGIRFAFANDMMRQRIDNGNELPVGVVELFKHDEETGDEWCGCSGRVHLSSELPADGELIGIASQGKLAAIYAYDAHRARYTCSCKFQVPVLREAPIV